MLSYAVLGNYISYLFTNLIRLNIKITTSPVPTYFLHHIPKWISGIEISMHILCLLSFFTDITKTNYLLLQTNYMYTYVL